MFWFFFPILAKSHFTWSISGNKQDLESLAQFGDTYGALNALFTSLALGGAIISIFMQSHELQLQRLEQEKSREHFKEQAESLASQLAMMKEDQVLTVFNSLMKLSDEHLSIIKVVHIRNGYFNIQSNVAESSEMLELNGKDALNYYVKNKKNFKYKSSDLVLTSTDSVRSYLAVINEFTSWINDLKESSQKDFYLKLISIMHYESLQSIYLRKDFFEFLSAEEILLLDKTISVLNYRPL